MQIRQGDVLLVPIRSIPNAANQDATADGRIVLAYGEVTGHAHVLDAPCKKQVNYRMTPEGARFVELVLDTALKHEEHAAIHVVQGKYQQGFQVEDFGQEIRRVAD